MSIKAGYCAKCDKVLVWLKGKLRHAHDDDGFKCKSHPCKLKTTVHSKCSGGES